MEKMTSKEKIRNLEKISEFAQVVDKLQTQINQMVLEIEPTNKEYTLGVFWRSWRKTIKIILSISVPFSVTLWALFGWIEAIDNKFKTADEKLELIKTDNIAAKTDREKLSILIKEIDDKLNKKNTEQISQELSKFKDDVMMTLLPLIKIDDNVDDIKNILIYEKTSNSLSLVPLIFMDEIKEIKEKIKQQEEKNGKKSPGNERIPKPID